MRVGLRFVSLHVNNLTDIHADQSAGMG